MAVTREQFEASLNRICEALTKEARTTGFTSSSQFEDRVRELAIAFCPLGCKISHSATPQIFPDIPCGESGIEVKFTTANTWRCIGNSIFEGHRDESVRYIYIVFGKMGGEPEARWGKYEDCVCHVRTSHVPRFEVEIGTERPLFSQLGIDYSEFCELTDEEKMPYVREYARSRLKEGEHLWWLEGMDSDDARTVPIAARLYTALSTQEKRQMRAEAALLCPEIAGSSRDRTKYNNVPLFLLTYHGVSAHQARDMFTAGSASHDGTCDDPSLNGNYLACALFDIQPEIKAAATYLPDELFVEYWGQSVPKEDRLEVWLEKLDHYASANTQKHWVPSEHLKFDKPAVYPPDTFGHNEYYVIPFDDSE